MSDCLPLLQWNLSVPPGYSGRSIGSVLRQWHRAEMLGLEVSRLKIGGHEKAAHEMERLNMWISAGGAWRCSLLPHWDAFNALEIQVGSSIAQGQRLARNASGAPLEMVLRDRCESSQT